MSERPHRSGEALPPALTWYIRLMTLAGGAALAGALLSPSIGTAPAVKGTVLAALFFVVGDLALVHLRFGHNNYSFTWSELAVVLGLVMVPSMWLVVIAAAAVALAQRLAKRPMRKLVFNVASTAVGAALARATCVWLGATDPGPILDRPSTWLVVALATFVFTVWNVITVAAAVALSQRQSVWSVFRKGAVAQFVVWAGNTAAGVSIASVAHESAGALIVLPLFLVLLYVVYFSYVQLSHDRDTWQVLQDTSGELSRLERARIAEVVVVRAATLLRAEFVELLLVDPNNPDAASVWSWESAKEIEHRQIAVESASTYWPRAQSERELFVLRAAEAPSAQRRELERLALGACAVVPLAAGADCVGTLRIGFRGPVRLRERERQVLRTLGNQLAVSVQNAWLYEHAREERAKLRRIVDNTSDGILAIDGSGAVTSWNPAMTRMTGLAAADVVGAEFTLGAAYDGDGTPVTAGWLWSQLGEGTTGQVKVSVEAPGVPRRWLALSIAAVRRSAGDVDSVVVVARDETALHEASRAKEQFVATVSHELRTPLTSLKGWVGTLLRPEFDPGPEGRREIHERLLHQTHRLQNLIEDLLNVSALDRGDFRVDIAAVGVDEVVDKALADFALHAPERPVAHRRAGLAGVALADPGRVEQVVTNLLSNAGKYSPPATPVEVTVERVGGDVHVTVSDRGYGIPADQLEAIFEPFHRLGDHMTREQPGTGVGLHIARRLVEAMHGRIWVTSVPGSGSTFTFTLPAAPLVAAPRRSPEALPLAASGQ